jgi:sphingomyelin phosphodiesterase acid-like 3
MKRVSRYLLVLILLGGFVMPACRDASTPAPDPPANDFQVVTVADLHFNPLYDPSLYSQLVAADPGMWASIYQGSKITSSSIGGTDTNYPLLQLALAAIWRQKAASPVVLFTGDMLGHNIPTLFYTQYYQTPAYQTPDAAATAAMQQFIDKTVAFVAEQIRTAAGKAPVMFAVGNIDTYGAGAAPDTTFFTNNAPALYTQFLSSTVDQTTFVSTFTTGGYYSAPELGSKLLVISLNSNAFVAGQPDNVFAVGELDWLNTQLAAAQAAGQKVWIIMHVPVGGNSQSTAPNAAKAGTPSQVNESTAAMMWDPGYQATFMQTLANYPGVITLMLAGHTHMDEYRILPTGIVLEQLPAISPCFGNNPSFKVFTVGQDTLTATDYQSFYFNLSNPTGQFESLYQLSTVYSAQGSINSSLPLLYPQLVGNATQRAAYIQDYDSGSTALIPSTQTPWNPITNTNWPIFACTISAIDQPDYIQCVNTY